MNFVSDGALRCLMKIHSNYQSKNYVTLLANLVPGFNFFLEGVVNYSSSFGFQLFEFRKYFKSLKRYVFNSFASKIKFSCIIIDLQTVQIKVETLM